MSKTAHRIYIFILGLIVSIVFIYLLRKGYSFYSTSIEERFYNSDYNSLKPSGIIGHGLGIIGSFLIIVGVSSYMARKRFRSLARLGNLKYWLEFHIFLCTLGPIMVLFHTSFKFGGLVAISFWSMVAVFLSGVIGRFIYIQIPRTIEGRELSLNEVRNLKSDVGEIIKNSYNLDNETFQTIVESTQKKVELYNKNLISRYIQNNKADRKTIHEIRAFLKKNDLSRSERRKVLKLVKNELSLNRRIGRLQIMQNLFRYWHVAHMPFALVMLIIMIIHVAVTITFGYRWIF